ncbi:MAG: T9SS type A sorting domain-containing protein [Flavobacteriales bacterium]|nr:T9SS type A sorting domain-containing protein [Flavobacteriales bacterium]
MGYTIVNNSSGTWDFIGTGATQGDKITATATDIKGNTSEFSANFEMIVGVEENNESNDFSVFPNPTSDILHLDFTTDQEREVNVSLYALTGQRIMQLDNLHLPAGHHILNYNVSSIAKGMYLLKIEDGNLVIGRIKIMLSK